MGTKLTPLSGGLLCRGWLGRRRRLDESASTCAPTLAVVADEMSNAGSEALSPSSLREPFKALQPAHWLCVASRGGSAKLALGL